MPDPTKRPWRTQMVAEVIEPRSGTVGWYLPFWSDRLRLVIPMADHPQWLLEQIHEGYRCRAMVNIGAEKLTDLVVTSWERPASAEHLEPYDETEDGQ